MSETKINDLRINKGLTKQQLLDSSITENELSFVTDDTVIDVPTPTESGKVLTSTENGVEWLEGGSGSGLPDQTGNAGKFLSTDGTKASWNLPYYPNTSQLVLTPDIDRKNTGNGSTGQLMITAGFSRKSSGDGYYNQISNSPGSIGLGYNVRIIDSQNTVVFASSYFTDVYTQNYEVKNRPYEFIWCTNATKPVTLFKVKDSNVYIEPGRLATTPTENGSYVLKTTITDGTQTVNWGTDTDPLDVALAKDQGSVNAGKFLKVGSDGLVFASSESSGGGLTSVSHDETLAGAGTDADPLRVNNAVAIDDESTAIDKVWSANKLNTLIGDIETLINAL